MEEKKVGDIPQLQEQLKEMGLSEEDMQKVKDATVLEFDTTTKKGRVEARDAYYSRILKEGGEVIIIGDPIPPPE